MHQVTCDIGSWRGRARASPGPASAQEAPAAETS